MPARKNRPGKFGKQIKKAPGLSALIQKIKAWERSDPRASHYVGWPDMTEARRLAADSYLVEDPIALGCFYVTDKFRGAYGQ